MACRPRWLFRTICQGPVDDGAADRVKGGRIEEAFYPVFPLDRSAAEVVGWLERKAQGSAIAR